MIRAKNKKVATADLNDYWSYEGNYLPYAEDSVEYTALWAELCSVNLKKADKSSNPVNTGRLVPDNDCPAR